MTNLPNDSQGCGNLMEDENLNHQHEKGDLRMSSSPGKASIHSTSSQPEYEKYMQILNTAKMLADKKDEGEDIREEVAQLRAFVEDLDPEEIPTFGGNPMLVVMLLEQENEELPPRADSAIQTSLTPPPSSREVPVPPLELEQLRHHDLSARENASPRRRRKRRLSAGNELDPEPETELESLPRMSLTAVSSVDCPPSLSASPIQVRLERSGLSWADFLYLFIVIAIVYWFYNHMSHHHCTADHPI
ncbi:hypothetical protein WR25_20590 [Diploscapter pachys]|uniref:Uncharacterized protein n=1 Tax=Diploscapter pachys TaxID=2018661 RepID=A0A2A2K5K8_9BILA|nr:hypothetical protein WR25_20590 [Diploscapter pachys]